MILLVRALKGSIFSASPVAEKSGQGCASMTGFSRASVAIRCARPCSSSVPVVADGRGRPVFEGEASDIFPG